MKPLSPAATTYWREYLATHAVPLVDPWVESAYAGNREITDGLLDLYLTGRKTAGSGLVRDYVSNGEPIPKVGNYWIALGGDDQPRLLLKTTSVEIHRFMQVPERIAIAEGEGDLSLDYWRRVHRAFYAPFCAAWGIPDLDEAEVVTEFFEIVRR